METRSGEMVSAQIAKMGKIEIIKAVKQTSLSSINLKWGY